MPYAVGIGIVTYNRKEIASETIERVRAFTRQPNAALVIADDGSTDGTPAMLRDKQVAVITGPNMGVAWNKNRALFVLSQMLRCDTVILLEDDARPNRTRWEAEWIAAARRWGHVNYAGDWMQEHFVSGAGSASDPLLSTMVTAQCAAYSAAALTYAGYLDSHFKGYGHGHVEHTRRLIRLGYGGSDTQIAGQQCVLYKAIKGDVMVVASQSHFDSEQEERNQQLAMRLIGKEKYRSPWRNDTELHQFRSEIEAALSGGLARFHLMPDQPLSMSQQPASVSHLFRQA